MNEIDWSKAPEGADKYNTHNSMFYKGERPDLQVFIHDQWEQSAIIQSNEHFVYRPATPSWSGEGLPPVGVVCEAKWGRSGWSRCVVFAHKPNANSGVDVLVDVDGDWTFFDKPSMFRPIRTPEQIEADEREAAIDAMFARFGGVGGLTRKQCAWVISEGYRKP